MKALRLFAVIAAVPVALGLVLGCSSADPNADAGDRRATDAGRVSEEPADEAEVEDYQIDEEPAEPWSLPEGDPLPAATVVTEIPTCPNGKALTSDFYWERLAGWQPYVRAVYQTLGANFENADYRCELVERDGVQVVLTGDSLYYRVHEDDEEPIYSSYFDIAMYTPNQGDRRQVTIDNVQILGPLQNVYDALDPETTIESWPDDDELVFERMGAEDLHKLGAGPNIIQLEWEPDQYGNDRANTQVLRFATRVGTPTDVGAIKFDLTVDGGATEPVVFLVDYT
ncbi:MAG: hypothetical protein LBG60_06895 [Bifidobacteriaceae bacterium]|nr:hypothetical protein [Bifidobacteriaceae bacterium]